MMTTVLDRLRIPEGRNLLIQGLPSSIEKQFSKVSFAKNLTPLLRSRRIDFALVFAVNLQQLSDILHEVVPALREEGSLWVAYPRPSSKIASDLNRQTSWCCILENGYENAEEVGLDHVWNAIRFERREIDCAQLDDASNRTEQSPSPAMRMPKTARTTGKMAGRI